MSDVQKADICVIGGGAAGVALASGAVQLGAKVILIERGQLGGENLHRGAVPLKALTAAANRAQSARDTRPFGITPMTPAVNFRQLAEHVQGTIAAVAPNASAERLAAFGIEVLRGSARFTAKDRVAVDTREIAARNFVIATGSTAELPAIAGLDKITHFTMGSFFSNIARFDHLVILGEGPHALEIGQAMVRLGSRVTIIARGKLLPDLDPELAQPLLAALTSEGIASAEDVSCDKVEKSDTGSLKLTLSKDGATEVLEASHLLVMGTRKPNTDGLDLGVAGVEHDASGIKVTNRLRTSNAAVYAIGDVTSGDPSATRARHEATVLVRRLVLGAAVVTLPDAVPRIVGTSPGLAQIGLSEAKAREFLSSGRAHPALAVLGKRQGPGGAPNRGVRESRRRSIGPHPRRHDIRRSGLRDDPTLFLGRIFRSDRRCRGRGGRGLPDLRGDRAAGSARVLARKASQGGPGWCFASIAGEGVTRAAGKRGGHISAEWTT